MRHLVLVPGLALLAPSALAQESHAAPKLLERAPPTYPAMAYRRGLEGCVRISYLVNEAGTTDDFKVEASHPERVFDTAAIHAVRKWRYQSAIPPVRTEEVIVFLLEQPGPVETAPAFSCNKKNEVLPTLLVLP